jgi:hypothetical protein
MSSDLGLDFLADFHQAVVISGIGLLAMEELAIRQDIRHGQLDCVKPGIGDGLELNGERMRFLISDAAGGVRDGDLGIREFDGHGEER